MGKELKSVYEIRIRKIFDEALEMIRQNKRPNISALMKKYKYKDSSAHTQSVTKTKAWRSALDEVADDRIVTRFGKIARGKVKGGGVREQIQAGVEVFKLKKRYPEKDRSGEVPTLKLIIDKKKPEK